MADNFILYNIGGIVTATHFVANAQVVPSGVTVSVYQGDGSVVIEDAEATIDVNGTMSFDLSAAQANEETDNWRATFKYTYADTIHQEIKYFDVVDSGFTPNWVGDDLTMNVANLTSNMTAGQISNYSYGAFRQLKSDIQSIVGAMGYSVNDVKDKAIFRQAGILKTIANISADKSTVEDDRLDRMSILFEAKYEKYMKKVSFWIDKDKNNIFTSPEEDSEYGGYEFSRPNWD